MPTTLSGTYHDQVLHVSRMVTILHDMTLHAEWHSSIAQVLYALPNGTICYRIYESCKQAQRSQYTCCKLCIDVSRLQSNGIGVVVVRSMQCWHNNTAADGHTLIPYVAAAAW